MELVGRPRVGKNAHILNKTNTLLKNDNNEVNRGTTNYIEVRIQKEVQIMYIK